MGLDTLEDMGLADSPFVQAGFGGERLLEVNVQEAGLAGVIAIHSTELGPALGGIRRARYASWRHGASEAGRLAETMTAKNAIAGIGFGGGKTVIFDHDDLDDSGAMQALGDIIARVTDYIPGVDMGTTGEDLAIIRDRGARVSCADVDPSPYTAIGVEASITAAVAVRLRRETLDGVTVLIHGVGRVGSALAQRLAAKGADIIVADKDAIRAREVAAEVGGRVVENSNVIGTPCDVFSPCATAGVVTSENVTKLETKIVAGAANDVLADLDVAQTLDALQIVYVPDFVANGGGVIQIDALERGLDETSTIHEIMRTEGRVREILDEAARRGITPLSAAHDRVERIIAAHAREASVAA